MKLSLSQHLFWDTVPETLDEDTDGRLIILRVLQYGLLSDWHTILDHYGLKIILDTAVEARELDVKTASFLSVIADLPKEKFKCYTSRQSSQAHWTF